MYKFNVRHWEIVFKRKKCVAYAVCAGQQRIYSLAGNVWTQVFFFNLGIVETAHPTEKCYCNKKGLMFCRVSLHLVFGLKQRTPNEKSRHE